MRIHLTQYDVDLSKIRRGLNSATARPELGAECQSRAVCLSECQASSADHRSEQGIVALHRHRHGGRFPSSVVQDRIADVASGSLGRTGSQQV